MFTYPIMTRARSTLLNGLLCWLECEETSGNNRVDSHTSGIEFVEQPTAIARTATTQPGVGYGIDFSANNTLLMQSGDAQLDSVIGADFTIGAHIWLVNASNDGIFGKNVGVGGESAIYLYMTGASGIDFYVQNDGNTDNAICSTTHGAPAVYSVVCTWNQSTKTAALIIDDGTPITDTVTGTVGTDTGTKDFAIGSYNPTPNSNSTLSSVYNFAIWDRVLTAAEITEFDTPASYVAL